MLGLLHYRRTAFLAAFGAVMACDATPASIPVGPLTIVSTAVLPAADEDFEAAPLGTLPSPFTTFIGCPGGTIGVSNLASRSGAQSLRYANDCFAPFAAAIDFAKCARWPTTAEWSLYRRQESYTYTAFSMHSLNESTEPGTSIQLGPDGQIRVSSDGVVSPNTVVGSYTTGQWTKFRTVWDFAGGSFDLHIDDTYRGTFPTRIRNADWADHGSNTPVTFYDDDIIMTLEVLGVRKNCVGA